MTESLDDLVLECLGRLEEAGGDLEAVLDGAAESHPERIGALRARLEALARVGLLDEPDAQATRVPERLGDFDLERRIGGGGMGVVYLARQRSMQWPVALKLVRPGHLAFDGARERFQREAEVAARLLHPNIVQVYTFGEENGVPYLAMELVRGSSLDRILGELGASSSASLTGADLLAAVLRTRVEDDETPPPPNEEFFDGAAVEVVLRIALGVARALGHAHDRGVLQRDVKPSNVTLTVDGRVQLLDFGLSSLAVGADRTSRSRTGAGSLPYMAPEQMRGEAVDERTDVYGLGVTLYELLCGRPAFAGRPDEISTRILEGRAQPLRRVEPRFSRDVDAVCAKAMDPDPARRYESADAFATDLGNLLAHRPVHARPAGLWTVVTHWARRRPGAAVAVGLVFLIAVGGPSFFAWQSARAQERLHKEIERGDRNHARVLDVLDSVMRIAVEDLEDVPMAETGRRDVLRQIADYFEELAREEADGGALAFERAHALVRLARAQEGLNELDKARKTLDEAFALFETLEFEPDTPLAEELGGAHWARGRLAYVEGASDRADARFDEAMDVLPAGSTTRLSLRCEIARNWRMAGESERALDEFTELITRFEERSATDPWHADQAAWCYGERGVLFVAAGRRPEARHDYARAVELRERLYENDPLARDRRELFVVSLSNLGSHLMKDRELEEALVHLERALDIATSLAEDFPRVPGYRYRVAGVSIGTGDAYALLSHTRGEDEYMTRGLEYLRGALETLQTLCDEFPDQADYRGMRALTMTNLAAHRMESGDYEVLDDLLFVGTEIPILERLRPGDITVAGLHSAQPLQWVRALIGLGRTREACDVAIAATSVRDPEALFWIAKMFGIVLESEESDLETLDKSYEAALTFIQRYLAAGGAPQRLTGEPVLEPLLEEPRIQRLLSR